MIKVVIMMLLSLGITLTASAQSKNEKIVIQTSAVCEMCKTNIEGALNKLEGVKGAYLDLKTMAVTVRYDATTLNAQNIIAAITLAGYDANEVPADEAAYENLHSCCKKDVVH
jgi:periplasmic mercuric ion binding protein